MSIVVLMIVFIVVHILTSLLHMYYDSFIVRRNIKIYQAESDHYKKIFKNLEYRHEQLLKQNNKLQVALDEKIADKISGLAFLITKDGIKAVNTKVVEKLTMEEYKNV